MGKTIIVFEDGKVVDTIEEAKWEGVKIENGRLVADTLSAPEPAAPVASEPAPAFSPAAPFAANIAAESIPADESIPAVAAESAFTAEAPPAVAPISEPASAVFSAAESEPAPAVFSAAESEPAPAVFSAAEADAPQAAPASAFATASPVEEPHAAAFEPLPHPKSVRTPLTEAPGNVERRAAPPYVAAAATAAAQYPWRGEAAYADVDGGVYNRSGVDAKKVIAVILGLVLAAGAGFGGGIAAINTGSAFYEPAVQQITINPTDQVSTTEAVAVKVIPSVVGITSVGTRTVDVFPFGSFENRSGGVGTGIIVDESGYILTNSHVVLDGEVDTLTVLLPDGRDVQGDVLWNERALDLAIVKVNAGNLVAAELGDSDRIKIGSYVAAIGNPMGLNFRSSISQGVVSGLDRNIVASSGSDQNAVPMEGLIQVDAAINVGNSGGPLVNSLGQVIGINTARNQDGEGMGFAIPINTAKPIVDSVKATGEFHRVYMGVTPVDVTEFLQAYPQSDLGAESGAYVYRLSPDSPAEAAGIQEKDIIIEVDGKQINTSSELIKHLLGYKSGDVAKVKIIRDKRQMTFDVTLTDSLGDDTGVPGPDSQSSE
ncbi:MAG: trypsin-like peptidase domain-containing protein [Clostridiales Family XIII bacterium]|jgi:S1-C subfamily serine protease|nr:trypsin-like peptidase domain-containing protein [Clostridiales Family XIII bacterium]